MNVTIIANYYSFPSNFSNYQSFNRIVVSISYRTNDILHPLIRNPTHSTSVLVISDYSVCAIKHRK